MKADFAKWVERWQAALTACEGLGGDNQSLTVAPPAALDEVLTVEHQLGCVLPPSFRTTLLEFSSRVDAYWFLPDSRQPPTELREIFSGDCNWSLAEIVKTDKEKQSWVTNVFPNVNNAYDCVWHNKLAFSLVPNGDYLAFDLSILSDPPVVYLSHDDGEGHGYRLGDNFVDFIERWTLLGCPGNEDWQMMPFLNDPTSGLDPYGENAQKWRQWFGLNV